jgi:hypothetical protein
MQPTFPPDHHFYRRTGRQSTLRGSRDTERRRRTTAELEAAYLARQAEPALDPSDPRGGR